MFDEQYRRENLSHSIFFDLSAMPDLVSTSPGATSVLQFSSVETSRPPRQIPALTICWLNNSTDTMAHPSSIQSYEFHHVQFCHTQTSSASR